MAENTTVVKLMQITLKGGINYKIGVSGKKEYEMKKEKIKKDKNLFVVIIPTLEIKKDQIISFEYFEEKYELAEEGENA